MFVQIRSLVNLFFGQIVPDLKQKIVNFRLLDIF